MYNQAVTLPLLQEKKISLFIKREDTIHKHISGNKYRKLLYNIDQAKKLGHTTLLTFGGAYSNHIAATAFAGKKYGFNTIGVIRGEELITKVQTNPTLQFAATNGMQLYFVSREKYRLKNTPEFLKELETKFGAFYCLPEGGTNSLAVKGCEEILTPEDKTFNFVCCPVGTGGTISGLINSSANQQQIIGFPALKGDFLHNDIRKFAQKNNWTLCGDFHFGGYAKVNKTLINFINNFKDQTTIPLDPVYTGKMMYGILSLVKKGYFKEHTKILAIHTGGLQGIDGMNMVLKQKNLPTIHV